MFRKAIFEKDIIRKRLKIPIGEVVKGDILHIGGLPHVVTGINRTNTGDFTLSLYQNQSFSSRPGTVIEVGREVPNKVLIKDLNRGELFLFENKICIVIHQECELRAARCVATRPVYFTDTEGNHYYSDDSWDLSFTEVEKLKVTYA